MSRIPSLSSREVVQALRKGGFLDAPKRVKGSHIAMVKKGSGLPRLVIIPERKVLPKGTLRAILEQAGLSREEFLSLL
jgi:predicted RNA binding protein YcfA (HicA-like mRNA interferase family)